MNNELNEGDYVLATKYSDGDFGDQWCVGAYSHAESGRHYVIDDNGKQFRMNGFRYARKISHFVGVFICKNAPMGDSEPLPYVESFNMRDLLDNAYEAEINQLRAELEQVKKELSEKSTLSYDTNGKVWVRGGYKIVPVELHPDTIKDIQMNDEIGAYICSNWSDAYDCLDALYARMIKGEGK